MNTWDMGPEGMPHQIGWRYQIRLHFWTGRCHGMACETPCSVHDCTARYRPSRWNLESRWTASRNIYKKLSTFMETVRQPSSSILLLTIILVLPFNFHPPFYENLDASNSTQSHHHEVLSCVSRPHGGLSSGSSYALPDYL